MNIGISLHSTREVLFLFSSPLLEYIKKDTSNHYLIFFDNPERISSLVKGYEHISIENYYLGNKLRKGIFYILIQPYEKLFLLNKKLIGDHEFSIKETWSYKKLTIVLGYIYIYIPFFKVILQAFRYIAFKTKYYEKFQIDNWLITEYHQYKEKVISYNYGQKTSFFPPSHDSYTLDGWFSNELKNYFVWTHQDKKFATNICNLSQEKIIETGNPCLENIKNFNFKGEVKNKILFMGSNHFVYNEVEMVQDLKNNSFLNQQGIDLRVSPGVNGVGEEWLRRKAAYEIILGKESVLLPSDEWFGENFDPLNLNNDYYESLYKHEIFIVPGVSNIAYDVLARNGILVLMFFRGNQIDKKFPWWTCKQREVLDHMKKEPNVIICETAQELEQKLRSYQSSSSVSMDNTYTKDIKSSEIIFNELIKKSVL